MSERFYADLEPVSKFHLAFDPSAYRNAPDSWAVIITDVVGSTMAIQQGRYKDVNALGVASIVAVRNAVPDIDFPFVFGGDGASMICPQEALPRIIPALQGVKSTARTSFSLEMRAGVIPISELSQAGSAIHVARLRVSTDASFALFAGGGLQVAERWLKDHETSAAYEVTENDKGSANFDGFECRWNPLPSRKGFIVSLLVQSTATEPASHYRQITDKLSLITEGKPACPVDVENLTLGHHAATFHTEAKLRSGQPHGVRFRLNRWKAQGVTLIGRVLLARNWNLFGFPQNYRDEVVQNSDYRKFDDMLRMVLDLAPRQVDALRAYLETERAAGRLHFGIHTADSATITCVVGDYSGNHIHFVDGSHGGYALAAKELKAQLASPPEAPTSSPTEKS